MSGDLELYSRHSSYIEKLLEHVFVSEVCQELWTRRRELIDVARSEVDSSGYDLIMDARRITRHIQLKSTRVGGHATSQKVNSKLVEKPSGCVVWMIHSEDPKTGRLTLSYRYFGGQPGMPLPPISDFKTAKHAKANAAGEKAMRPGIKVIQGKLFHQVRDLNELVELLFGLPT